MPCYAERSRRSGHDCADDSCIAITEGGEVPKMHAQVSRKRPSRSDQDQGVMRATLSDMVWKTTECTKFEALEAAVESNVVSNVR